jgi:magnesium chelatase family protein
MTLATILSRSSQGMEAPPVRVEVDVGSGLPSFSVVGLLETAVKESKDRVRAALANCGYEFPAGRVTVNLAPADLPKEGGRFDLAIAIGILVANDNLPAGPFHGTELYGELSLGGDLHGIRGVLPTALQAARAGHAIILPQTNATEAALARNGRVFCAQHLLEVCRHARGIRALPIEAPRALPIGTRRVPDLADVRGQPGARRALEIAAAGEHSLLLIGPPGAGKSMLAQRLPGILPPMSEEDALETAAVRSLSIRGFRTDEWRLRPFRSPHHTASGAALVGGGSHPRPGEISLAHNGVLFLDELPEFDRHVLEVLREPLESGHIVISRAARQCEFPARFQLVAAMNPCPCGHFGDARGRCRCAPERIESYRGRVSGPLLDRIDLHVEVGRVDPSELAGAPDAESSSRVAERVAAARERQLDRQGKANARLDNAEVAALCMAEDRALSILGRAMKQLALSARAYHRVLRVARTIADLADCAPVCSEHVAEAVALRSLDRRASHASNEFISP